MTFPKAQKGIKRIINPINIKGAEVGVEAEVIIKAVLMKIIKKMIY